jgi:hypothetical protein
MVWIGFLVLGGDMVMRVYNVKVRDEKGKLVERVCVDCEDVYNLVEDMGFGSGSVLDLANNFFNVRGVLREILVKRSEDKKIKG